MHKVQTSIPIGQSQQLLTALSKANIAFNNIYTGDRPERQAVHTVYGGANLFRYDSARSLAEKSLDAFRTYAPDFITFARVFELEGYEALQQLRTSPEQIKKEYESLPQSLKRSHPAHFALMIHKKVAHKLATEAVEDFRIDFEDGYGNRSNEEEDATAVQAAHECAKGMKKGTLMPFIGIRIKPFTEDMVARGLRTLDIFVTTLLAETKGKLPNNFIVMLPKVTIPEQVSTLVSFFEIMEAELGLDAGTLKMEMMVETTQSILDDNGQNPLMRYIRAGKGRLIATHFGTYDYTASCGITAKYQEMNHPVCDFAHHVTKVALAHTGIWLSDGATNTMPIGPHRGDKLTLEQLAENREIVHRAWKKGYDHIRHSLWNGFYQGWDLNPAQLPMRYTAVYAFFLESYDDAVERLKTFVEKAARATLIGDVFDDAATGQGLLNYFLRALNSGAISEEEVMATGLTLDEIRSRSFKQILENRKMKND